jgi:cell division protein FtsL
MNAIPFRRRRSTTFFIALAVVCATVVALVHVYIHLQVIQAGYELGRETKTRHELTEQNQRLRLELATRKDPSLIERRAREELHMQTPDPGAIRVITVGRSGPIAVRP